MARSRRMRPGTREVNRAERPESMIPNPFEGYFQALNMLGGNVISTLPGATQYARPVPEPDPSSFETLAANAIFPRATAMEES